MSQISFLLDEHMPDALINAILKWEPSISVLRIGQAGAPPKGTLDSQVLEYAENERMMIFTHDKRTMRPHAEAHIASGRNTFGVFIWTKARELVVGRRPIWSYCGQQAPLRNG